MMRRKHFFRVILLLSITVRSMGLSIIYCFCLHSLNQTAKVITNFHLLLRLGKLIEPALGSYANSVSLAKPDLCF